MSLRLDHGSNVLRSVAGNNNHAITAKNTMCAASFWKGSKTLTATWNAIQATAPHRAPVRAAQQKHTEEKCDKLGQFDPNGTVRTGVSLEDFAQMESQAQEAHDNLQAGHDHDRPRTLFAVIQSPNSSKSEVRS